MGDALHEIRIGTMHDEHLWNDYRATRDVAIRNRIVEDNLRLVHHVARRMVNGGSSADLDDMVSAGTIGLMSAVEKFQPERGLAFSTFATPRIRGAMLDSQRRDDHASRSVRAKERKIEDARARLAALLDRLPTEHELAEELGLGLDELWSWQRAANSARRVSLDAPVGGGSEGESLDWGELLTGDDGGAIHDRLHREEELRRVREALAEMSERDRTVVSLYYFEELKLKQIAELLDVTESRVSQIRSSAVGKLRRRLAPQLQEAS
jgi:RNA polymerase sigma factor for flagellar operon FliA